jgi:hypothetical protein
MSKKKKDNRRNFSEVYEEEIRKTTINVAVVIICGEKENSGERVETSK